MIEEISAERSLLHQIRIGRMIVRYTRLPEPIPQSQDGSGLAMLTIGVHTSEVNGVVAHRIDVVGIPAITQVIEEGSLTDTWLLYKPYSQPIGLYEQKMRRKSAKKVQGGGPHHSVPANFTTSYCPPLPYPQPYRPHPYAPAPYPMPPQVLPAPHPYPIHPYPAPLPNMYPIPFYQNLYPPPAAPPRRHGIVPNTHPTHNNNPRSYPKPTRKKVKRCPQPTKNVKIPTAAHVKEQPEIKEEVPQSLHIANSLNSLPIDLSTKERQHSFNEERKLGSCLPQDFSSHKLAPSSTSTAFPGSISEMNCNQLSTEQHGNKKSTPWGCGPRDFISTHKFGPSSKTSMVFPVSIGGIGETNYKQLSTEQHGNKKSTPWGCGPRDFNSTYTFGPSSKTSMVFPVSIGGIGETNYKQLSTEQHGNKEVTSESHVSQGQRMSLFGRTNKPNGNEMFLFSSGQLGNMSKPRRPIAEAGLGLNMPVPMSSTHIPSQKSVRNANLIGLAEEKLSGDEENDLLGKMLKEPEEPLLKLEQKSTPIVTCNPPHYPNLRADNNSPTTCHSESANLDQQLESSSISTPPLESALKKKKSKANESGKPETAEKPSVSASKDLAPAGSRGQKAKHSAGKKGKQVKFEPVTFVRGVSKKEDVVDQDIKSVTKVKKTLPKTHTLKSNEKVKRGRGRPKGTFGPKKMAMLTNFASQWAAKEELAKVEGKGGKGSKTAPKKKKGKKLSISDEEEEEEGDGEEEEEDEDDDDEDDDDNSGFSSNELFDDDDDDDDDDDESVKSKKNATKPSHTEDLDEVISVHSDSSDSESVIMEIAAEMGMVVGEMEMEAVEMEMEPWQEEDTSEPPQLQDALDVFETIEDDVAILPEHKADLLSEHAEYLPVQFLALIGRFGSIFYYDNPFHNGRYLVIARETSSPDLIDEAVQTLLKDMKEKG